MLEHKRIDSKNRTIYKNKKLIKIIYQEYYQIIKKPFEGIQMVFLLITKIGKFVQ